MTFYRCCSKIEGTTNFRWMWVQWYLKGQSKLVILYTSLIASGPGKAIHDKWWQVVFKRSLTAYRIDAKVTLSKLYCASLSTYREIRGRAARSWQRSLFIKVATVASRPWWRLVVGQGVPSRVPAIATIWGWPWWWWTWWSFGWSSMCRFLIRVFLLLWLFFYTLFCFVGLPCGCHCQKRFNLVSIKSYL